MSGKLALIREAKLYRLLPGRTARSRLEASGVAVLDGATILVVFDNLNQLARLDGRPAPDGGRGAGVDARGGRPLQGGAS